MTLRADPQPFGTVQRSPARSGLTLKELGAHFGFSRERARQLENRAKEKLKRELHALAVEIDWPRAARA